MNRIYFFILIHVSFNSALAGFYSTAHPLYQIKLTELEDEISYFGFSANDTRLWQFPILPSKHFVAVIHVKSLGMSYDGPNGKECSARLYLPDRVTCQHEPPFCHIYATPELSCNLKFINKELFNHFSHCDGKINFVNVEELPKRIAVTSYKDEPKSFTMKYKFIQCSYPEPESTTPLPSDEPTTSGNENPENQKSSRFLGSLHDIHVLIIFVALGAILFICIIVIIAMSIKNYRSGSDNEIRKTRTSLSESAGKYTPKQTDINQGRQKINGHRQPPPTYETVDDDFNLPGPVPDRNRMVENVLYDTIKRDEQSLKM
ncbi:uncharacterized protein LOC120337738 [Styela clava]